MTIHPSREGGGRKMPNYKAITLMQSKAPGKQPKGSILHTHFIT